MGLLKFLFRLAFYSFLTWLALAFLWLGLPSPSREYSSFPNRYALETLSARHTLVRIYNTRASSTDGYSVSTSGDESRRSFAITYRLEQQRNTTLLFLQDGLTTDLSPSYVTAYPFTSQEKYTLVNTGDQDGINPPWFTPADSTLLYWWIHGDKGKLALEVYWADANTIEIRDAEAWSLTEPLLKLRFEKPAGNFGNQLRLLKAVELPLGSSSPSATYAFRVAILAIIAPTGLVVMGVVGVLGPVMAFAREVVLFLVKVLGIYCLALVVIWLVRGRSPIAEDDFMSRFPGMEFFGGQGAGRRTSSGRRTVWGPSGPFEIDGEEDMRTPRRQIRNVADFFRSSAPLDDLLASFDSTRRFTEPLGWRYRPEPRRDDSMRRNASIRDIGRHRKADSKDGLEESGLIDLEKAMPEKPGMAFQR